MTVVGSGAHRYELHEGWAKLPAGWQLGQTSIATDRENNVYLFNRSDHPMIVLDSTGNVTDSWGQDFLTPAHFCTIDGDDHLYLALHKSHVVLKCTTAGEVVMTLGAWDQPSDTGWSGNWVDLPLRAAGPFHAPTDIAVADGDIYVTDGYGNARVHRFSPSGELRYSWGAPGSSAPGEFHVPHGVVVDPRGRVLVADRENHRVQIFSPEGRFLTQWTDFARPCAIFIDGEDFVYVSDLDRFVTVRDLDGNVVSEWSAPTRVGPRDGAHGLWVDGEGSVYVGISQEGNRLAKYRRV